ncbi:MAG TPA: sugar transferase [archaeon]|nr:sugar transferase [archaeon]
MKRTYKDTLIFHSQVRIGRSGKPIVIPKFRTMVRNAHGDSKAIEAQEGPAKFAIQDKRRTTFGKFLRRSGLDELPQIIKLLQGDLIVVGIRPQTKKSFRKFPADIQEIYKEMGPSLMNITYACKHFPPTTDEVYNEFRAFYGIWKKNKKKAYLVYALRIAKNFAVGKSWTR